jgi:hypothetical protein
MNQVPVTPASSTTKTGHHDIAEILLKVALNTKNQIKSNQMRCYRNLTQKFTKIGSRFGIYMM